MKIKVSELSGAALEWAVAKCEGVSISVWMGQAVWAGSPEVRYNYSTNWAQGGPIIERMLNDGLLLKPNYCPRGDGTKFVASLPTPNQFNFGPTPLIAAMRCYVASKLGNEVEIPDKLTKKGNTEHER